MTLSEPIRYGAGDKVEAWLHELLCLDVSSLPYKLSMTPSPEACDLFHINRDALFSYHKVGHSPHHNAASTVAMQPFVLTLSTPSYLQMSEAFLQRVMSLYVSSHYKNAPNDLQLMSDAPAHRLFALLAPVNPKAPAGSLPDVLCVVQVSVWESQPRGLTRVAVPG